MAEKVAATIEKVTMEDGREVAFAGTRKMNKTHEPQSDGSVSARVDFRSGQTVTVHITPDLQTPDGLSVLLLAAGHGLVQKLGDEAAGAKSEDDAIEAVSSLATRLERGEWYAPSEGGSGFSGSGTVVRALMEHTGQPQEKVREFLEKKLAALQADAEAKGEKAPTRAAMYQSFRRHAKIGEIIARMEKEKADKATPVVDVDAEMEALKAA